MFIRSYVPGYNVDSILHGSLRNTPDTIAKSGTCGLKTSDQLTPLSIRTDGDVRALVVLSYLLAV